MPLILTTEDEQQRWDEYSIDKKNYLANQSEVLGCGGNVSLSDLEQALDIGI